MKCPICSAEIASDAYSCPSCRAILVVERTTLGVFAGWLGIVATVLTAMILIPIPLMIFGGVSLVGFPWWLPLVGTCIAAPSLWYSRSTRHTLWLPRTETR
jgi:hypothetical protein